jgi:hypothetical protein
MNNPKVITASRVSNEEFLPKLLDVSTHITGKIKRLTTGIKSRKIHHQGLLMIFIKIIALYMGINENNDLYPAFLYNFQVPKP